MKKIITKIMVCLLVCVSAITMFACGSKFNKKESFEVVNAVITEINTDNQSNKMFVTTNISGVKSDYALRYYVGNTTYNYYNECLIVPMNYIQKYYTDLQRIEALEKISKNNKAIINELTEAVPALRIAYKETVDRYNNLKSVGSSEVLVEGATQVYNQSLKEFIKSAYDVALKLANVKNQVFNDFKGLSVTNRVLSSSDTAVLRDYFVLYNAYDYYNCLIANLKAEDFSSIVGNNDVENFVNFIKSIKTKLTLNLSVQAISDANLKVLTGNAISEKVDGENVVLRYENTMVDKLFEAFETVQNERVMLNKSFENFSLYDFYIKHSCNMDAYATKVDYANDYYSEIKNYYNAYNKDYVSYLISLLKLGV